MKFYRSSYEDVNVVYCDECGMLYNIRSMVPHLTGMLQIPDYCPGCGTEGLEEIVSPEEDLSHEEYIERCEEIKQ